MNLFNELKRRHVFRVGLAYLVVAWLLAQIVGLVSPIFGLPQWFPRAILIALAVGFPVALILAWAFEMTPEGVKRTDGLDEAAPKRAVSTGRKLDFVIIGALVIAVGFLVWRLNYGPAATKTAASPTTKSAPTLAKATSDVLPDSVAVLPFENLSPDPKDAYFAAGLHEEVIDQISKIHSMSVIARPSVMQYAKGTTPVPEVARELHVQTVMVGSVRFANDRVRVSAQLVDGVTGTNLWSDTYEQPLGDTFKIEADIAMNVANALQAKFTPEEQARIEKPPTKSPEAYALYLQISAAYLAGDMARVKSLLQRAIEIDPNFASAYGLLAEMQAITLVNDRGGNAAPAAQRTEQEALSRKNAERAIELDPDVPFARTALAEPALVHWHWAEADKGFARALEVAPNDNGARTLYGFLLSWMGRHDEAVAIAKRAVELNPDQPNAGNYGIQLAYAGRYAAAADVLERGIAIEPTNLLARDWLATVEIARDNSADATKQLELSEQIAGASPPIAFLADWAYSYGRVGRRADAERLFQKIKDAAGKGAEPGAGGWAMAYLAIGDEKHALEWLEKAAAKVANHEPDEGLYPLMNMRANVTNDPALKKPEFARVLSRIKGD